MNDAPSLDDDDVVRFIDEPSDWAPSTQVAPWRILIVDDEADVHEATLLALRDLTIEGRPLAFLQAYSAQEARAILAQDPSVAVVLLDVVMESEDAGLQPVRWIRRERANQSVRVSLRTGQPGYAPELETIRSFDINDYRTKSELTRVRLFTSLTVAIRSYAQIRQIEMSRRGLELIVEASTGLIRRRALQQFAEGVVTQVCALLNIAPEGLICASSSGPFVDAAPLVIAAAGRYRETIHRPLAELHETPVREALRQCLLEKRHRFDQGVCLYFDVSETQGMAAYLAMTGELSRMDRHLLEVFCANISVGFENVLLHNRLFRLAYYDPLSGLPNRNRFIQLVEEKGGDPNMALALLDLDDFADIAVPDYAAEPDVYLDIITLDSATCPPCQYMLAAAEQVARKSPGVVVREHKIKNRDGLGYMTKLKATAIPTICIDGKPAFSSIIPNQTALAQAVQQAADRKK